MWSDVELLTNDDTVRQGSVSVEDSSRGLYQLDTVVRIAPDQEVLANPHLSSSSGANWSFVVVDKTVILFDQNYQTILLLLNFETDVDALDICLGGQFLLVCERNGNLHLIYVPHKRILLTKALVQEPFQGQKTYMSVIIEEDRASSGMYHVFCFTINGFFHVSDLALAKMDTAIAKLDVGAMKELQSLIKIDFCSTEDQHDDSCITAMTFSLGQEIHLIIGGDSENVLTHWTMDRQAKMCLSHCIDNSLISGVRKAFVVDNYMYILDTEDILSLWDLHFFIIIQSWPDLAIHDFQLMSECGSASLVAQEKGNLRMITLTKDGNQIQALQVRNLPSMTVCFSMDVSSVCCLVQTSLNMDTIYLVEGVYGELESQGGPVSSVIVKCFTEVLPENRLSRLLHKHMFEEAEKFATTFDLDVELVYKVKLDFVLEQLASASADGYGQEVWSDLFEEAKTNLMKITDEHYVVEYCLKAPWPTFETAEKMFNYAATEHPCLQIQEALARLATFCNLHGQDNFNSIAWMEFLNSTDNIGDVLFHLSEGDFRGAQLLWLRYEGQIAEEFDESKLEALLGAIPEDLRSQQLCPWFRTVIVPFVRRVLPKGQKILASWLEQRARNLELTEKGAWPQNGLDLAELGLPAKWTWMQSDDDCGAEEVETLRTLVSNLRHLLDLHRKYNCKVSLSVFEKGNVQSIAFIMLDKVPAPALIPDTVKSCILPYTEEHQLSLDELLFHYIKDLLERCSSQTTTLFAEWEAKAVAVLGCMTDTDLMVDAVLEIMQKAVVPWSSVVEKLVQQYLSIEGPKQSLLKESHSLMEMRKLLRGYGIRSLSNSTQIMTLIRYILKQDLPTSLDDAVSLAGVYKLPTSQIYYLYIIQLVSQGRVEDCMTVLKRLSASDAECVIDRLTSWARLQLEDKDHLSDEHKKHQMVIAHVMVEVLKDAQVIQKDDALKNLEYEANLSVFKTIAQLQEDFDVFFTPSDYEDPEIRKQIQDHHITAYENAVVRCPAKGKSAASPAVVNPTDGQAKAISYGSALRRLGARLRRTEQELLSDLALRAVRAGKVDKALEILSELYQHHSNATTGQTLFTAAQTLCKMLEADVPMVIPKDGDLPAVIHNLACQAVTVCHADLLLDCLELCKSTRIAMDVYRQCQFSDNYGFVAKDSTLEAEKDPYSQWTFQDVFSEDCIVLDPVSVLPVQYEITNCLLPLSKDIKLYPLDCSCLSNCSFENGTNYIQPLLGPLANMLQMLQECSQLELALRVLLNSYGSCVQHIASNVMDKQLKNKTELMKYNKYFSELQKATASTLNTITVALLNKVFNWRVVDCDWAIALCTLLPKQEVFKIVWKVIDNTWQNYDKISAVAKIGADLCCMYGDEEEQQKFLSVITDAEWGIKLSKLEISIQSVFRQGAAMKSSLIPALVKHKNITPDVILEYCSAYELDKDHVINQYITTLLLHQDDDEDAGGASDFGIGFDGVQSLSHGDTLERVLQIIPMLHSTRDLTDSLSAAMFKLSPYNYERIGVVLKIIQAAHENVTTFSVNQAIGLLQHLKSYKRISPPADIEHTYHLENGLLTSPLSSGRLPFHLLMQTRHFWKIISPELSEETFPTLLLIGKLMKVNLDKLYMAVANHVFEKKMKPLLLEQSRKGQGHGVNKETFKVAKTMMKYIQSIQNHELAAATAHQITQELPPGHEKTQSLRFCLRLGEAWLKNANLEEAARSRGETFLSKTKLQFQRSATENTLTNSQLSSPEHLKLSGLPGRLILTLYEHSSVEQRYRDSGGQSYPDIHTVVKEIATINNVDLLKIRNMLLEKWICKTGPAMAKDISCEQSVADIEDDPDLMRVVYMLQNCARDDAVRLLSPILSVETWPLSASGPRLTFCHRTRALLCLIRLADATTLETHINIPSAKLKYHLKCYIYISQLEALNIPFTVQSFLISPKEGLVKGLWKNHSHEPEAVRLVADLCLEYQVYDPQLWNGLLQKMLSLNLIQHLQRVLEATLSVPSLWEISSFSRTWRSTILAPFVSASLPLSPHQQEIFYRTFVLLLKSPFLLNLDLIGIANRFAQLGLLVFALGTLLLIPFSNKKAQQIQGFLSLYKPIDILDQVDELMNTGELAGIPSQIRETVLIYISQSGQQQQLLKTKHFKHLKELVVSSNQSSHVKDLVEYLMSQSCQDEADSLAREYMNHRERNSQPDRSSICSPSVVRLKELLNKENGVST